MIWKVLEERSEAQRERAQRSAVPWVQVAGRVLHRLAVLQASAVGVIEISEHKTKPCLLGGSGTGVLGGQGSGYAQILEPATPSQFPRCGQFIRQFFLCISPDLSQAGLHAPGLPQTRSRNCDTSVDANVVAVHLADGHSGLGIVEARPLLTSWHGPAMG